MALKEMDFRLEMYIKPEWVDYEDEAFPRNHTEKDINVTENRKIYTAFHINASTRNFNSNMSSVFQKLPTTTKNYR